MKMRLQDAMIIMTAAMAGRPGVRCRREAMEAAEKYGISIEEFVAQMKAGQFQITN